MAKRENTKITDNSYLQFSKIPPQATDLEEAVLGALMLEKDSISKVAGELKPEMFYKEAHQHIYEAIKDLYLKVQPVDLLTVTRRLKDKGMLDVIGGPVYLVQCQKAVVSSSNIEYHSKIIIQKYLAREIIRISSELATEAYEDTTDIFELIEKSQSEMFSLTNFENVQIVPMSENVRLYVDYIDKSFDKQITGIPTGFTLFDRHTKGLQPTDLIIIAAESSVGKTSFALSIVSNVVLQGYGVFFASYEMSNIQLTGRILSGMSEVIQDEILRGHLTEDDRSKFNAAINDISDSKLYLYDIKNNSIHNLISAIRKHKILFNIEVAVVDYLQLVSGDKGKNREQEIGEISRMLKNIAKELNITVIALSQLNRDKDHYPTMNRLRDSGQILESADNVVFIYRQDMWIGEGYSETYKDGTPADGVAKIIFAKGRNIGVTDFYMDFDPKITKFKNRNTYLPTQNEF